MSKLASQGLLSYACILKGQAKHVTCRVLASLVCSRPSAPPYSSVCRVHLTKMIVWDLFAVCSIRPTRPSTCCEVGWLLRWYAETVIASGCMQAGELPLYSMYATGTVSNNVFIKQCGTNDSILHALCTGCNAWISSCLLTLFGPAELAGSLQRKLGAF